MFLQMLKNHGSPIHYIHLKPTKTYMHKSIKGLQVQPIAQVTFDCIFFAKSSLTNSSTWWNEYNFLPKVPKVHKSEPICVPFQIATTCVPNLNNVLFSHSCQSCSVNSRSSPLHMSLSSSMFWNFNYILSSHNLVIVMQSLSLLGQYKGWNFWLHWILEGLGNDHLKHEQLFAH